MKQYGLILAVGALALIACSPENGNSNTESGEIEQIEYQILDGGSVHHNYVLNFTRDASGRISGITETHYILSEGEKQAEPHSTSSLTITYDDKIDNLGTIARHSDGSDYEDSFVLNDDGTIKEFSQEKNYKSTFVYDNGYLTKILGYDNYSGMDITWSNGDMVKADYSDIQYSTDPNPFANSIDFTVRALNEWYPSPLFFYAAGFFGKRTAHLFKSISDENDTFNYDYIKDKKGRIEKITLSMTSEGVSFVREQYVIHYK